MDWSKKVLFWFIAMSVCTLIYSRKSHIIVIVADDLGWNDVAFHGSVQIPTPNIDALAYAGVILNNYYVQPICTPSRSALLSGVHPIHTGLQHRTIGGGQPYGLNLSLSLLPERLSDLGYVARHVGKWHVGHYRKEYTPLYRGFRSHYGYWTGRIDYYSHTSCGEPGWWGYDFRRNMDVDREAYGKYATDIFTEESIRIINEHNATEPLFLYLAHLAVHSANPYNPLQAPAEVVKQFSYIEDENRRKFAGMLWLLDDSIGKVVKALEDNGMLQDSIIVFTTDNGGPAAGFNDNAASNWPLRGVKASVWEGGVRGAGFIWSPLIENPGRVSTQMMQITDWLPTLYAAAGGNMVNLPTIDGMNMWESIVQNEQSPRQEILHNIDPIVGGAALRSGEYKLLFLPSGYGSEWDGWFGPSGRSNDSNSGVSSTPESESQLIKNSLAGKAVAKVMPGVYQDIPKLKKSAEVLCGPVPENATQSCNDSSNPCLFHIASDPCEYFDVSEQHPDQVQYLHARLKVLNETAVPPANEPWDPAANPVFWDYTWTHWMDFEPPPSFWFSRRPSVLG